MPFRQTGIGRLPFLRAPIASALTTRRQIFGAVVAIDITSNASDPSAGLGRKD
jgi:hypothetical protein